MMGGDTEGESSQDDEVNNNIMMGGDTEGESSQDDEVNNNIMMGGDCFRCWIRRRGRSVIRTVTRRGRAVRTTRLIIT